MSKAKKEINKERMFKKIMPSNLKGVKPNSGFPLKEDEAETTVPLSPTAPAELHIKLSVATEEKSTAQTKPDVPEEAPTIPAVTNPAEAEPKAEIPLSEEPAEEPVQVETVKEIAVEPEMETIDQDIEDCLPPDLSPPPQPLHSSLVLANIMEDLVAQKLDDVMEKFRCCRCKRCRMDVTAMALNKLTPKYVAYDRDQLRDLIQRQDGSHVMAALIQAAIAVKAKPRHNLEY